MLNFEESREHFGLMSPNETVETGSLQFALNEPDNVLVNVKQRGLIIASSWRRPTEHSGLGGPVQGVSPDTGAAALGSQDAQRAQQHEWH